MAGRGDRASGLWGWRLRGSSAARGSQDRLPSAALRPQLSALSPNRGEFFVVGGTLRPDTPSYVERRAEGELFQALAEGKFCYMLTARQTGKSSLMVRTAAKLREVGIAA